MMHRYPMRATTSKRGPVALLDACVLVPMPVADTLLRLPETPALFQARWSDDILAEVTRTLRSRFAKSPDQANYRETTMRTFFPDSLVCGYHSLISTLENHPKDRHVLAAAMVCQADFLVTFNFKDFPAKSMSHFRGSIIDPSTFLRELWALDPVQVKKRIEHQAEAIRISTDHLLRRLAQSVPGFVSVIG